jgi:hypothetical protein
VVLVVESAVVVGSVVVAVEMTESVRPAARFRARAEATQRFGEAHLKIVHTAPKTPKTACDTGCTATKNWTQRDANVKKSASAGWLAKPANAVGT